MINWLVTYTYPDGKSYTATLKLTAEDMAAHARWAETWVPGSHVEYVAA